MTRRKWINFFVRRYLNNESSDFRQLGRNPRASFKPRTDYILALIGSVVFHLFEQQNSPKKCELENRLNDFVR